MSRRELYKARLNETTIADRRRSRGHERKQKREDEVNKRRLLSDDMSPLKEESCSAEGDNRRIDKKQQKKPESRAEQLKRWREEKKKATEESKKQAISKPSFHFKKLEHKDAMTLFKKKTFAERAAEDKKAAPCFRAAPAPKAKVATKLVKSVTAKPSTKIAAKAPSTKQKVGEMKPTKSATKLSTKKEQATEVKVVTLKKSTKSNPKPVNPVVQEAKAVAAKRTQRKIEAPEEIKRDLTQLTAAAKARMNGVEKKSNFLKSKHQTIPLSSRQKKITKKTPANEDIPTKVEEHIDQASAEPVSKGNLQRLDSGSQSDPHLSDSAVTSPKHSTPFPKKGKSGAARLSSAKKAPTSAYRRSRRSIKTPRRSRTPKGSNTSVSTIEVSCAGGPDTQFEADMDHEMPEALENVSPMEVFSGFSDNNGSQSPTVLEKPQRVNTPKSASRSRLRKSLATSAMVAEGACPIEENQSLIVKVSTSPSMSDRQDKENALANYMSSTSKAKGRKSLLSDFKEENDYYQMSPRRQSARKTPKKQTPRKTPRRKSSRLVATPAVDVYDFNDQEEYMSPMKKMKPSTPMINEEAEIVSHEEILQPAIVQLKNTQSFAKRRSLRLVASENESAIISNSTEQDQAELAPNNTDIDSVHSPNKQKKTPKRTSRRPNKRQLCATSPVWSDSPPLVSLLESGPSEIETETDPYDPTDPIVDTTSDEESAYPVLPLTPSSSRQVRTSLVVCVSEEDGPTPESPKSSRRSVRQSLVVSFCEDGAASGNVSVSGHDMSVHMENVSVCSEAVTGPVVPAAYLIAHPEETEGRVLQELCVDKLEQDQSFFEVPMDDSMASQGSHSPAGRSRLSSRGSPLTSHTSLTSSGSTQPFSPRRSQDVTASSQGSINTPCVTPAKGAAGSAQEEEMETLVTPRSLRARGRSMAPASAFKEPGEPLSAMRPKSARRKTEHRSTPSRTPEQMIEILKKSPMIEMSRRRSRHVSSPAVTQNHFTALMNDDVFTQVVDKANKSAPDLNQSPDLAELNFGVENLSLPEDALTDPTHEELQAAKVKPFRDLVITQTARLNTLCDTWNNVYDTTTGICDDTRGEIRSTVGKAQLLMRQRFKQFTGLVDNCEFNSGEKETSPTDLQGFWEMIYFQVEDVDRLFGDLSKQQENGWQVKETSPAKVEVIKKKPAVKTSKAKAKSTKSNFAAFRAEMMKRKAAGDVPVIPVVPATEEAPEIKTFDAGFFAVSSPVRSPASSALRPASQPSSPTKSGDHQDLHKPDVPKVVGASSLNPLNKENEVSTPRRSLLLSKKLRYAPSVNSPLLNDITDK